MHKHRRSYTQALRSVARILGALVILVAQAGAVGAGIMHSRTGSNADAHFESDGTNLHFAHNEADCYMCRAQHPDGATPHDTQTTVVPVASFVSIDAREAIPGLHDWYSPQQSRAPPSIV